MIQSLWKIKVNPLIFISLFCYTICDIFTGLGFLDLDPFHIVNISWVFYIPALTILAIIPYYEIQKEAKKLIK